MVSNIQTFRQGGLGEDNCHQVPTKNTFVHFQFAIGTPKNSSRPRFFTDNHIERNHGKNESFEQLSLSLCETVEGSPAESETESDSWHSDGEKHAEIRQSVATDADCCLGASIELVNRSQKSVSHRPQRLLQSQDQQKDSTTVMFRNLPNNYTRDMVIDLLDSEGFRQCYNFLYLPIDFQKGAGLGYAFVNFVSNGDAVRAMQTLENFDDWKVPSQKALQVSWNSQLQGLDANIERYRNSAVMHPDVPQQFKPLLFENGCPIQLPAPTRNIALGIRSQAADACGRRARNAKDTSSHELAKSSARKVQQRNPACHEVQSEKHSTVMMRNLPNDYTRDLLVELLESAGFQRRFDFVYFPVDFKRGAGLGYAFVNFIHHEDAQDAMRDLAGFNDWKVPSVKVLQLSWSMPLQGFSANIERYRNNSVMHPDVPEHFKPLVFRDGRAVPFPPPTRNIKPPHRRR